MPGTEADYSALPSCASAAVQLEYDNIEGMILLSELSRRRIRSIQKLIRVGRNEVVVVMRVDKEKGELTVSSGRASAVRGEAADGNPFFLRIV